jgi:Universal stress protein family
VVGVDGSAVSTDAVGFAFEEASWRSLELTAVHAYQNPSADSVVGGPDGDPRHRDALRVLSESLAGWREKFPEVPVVEWVVHPGCGDCRTRAPCGSRSGWPLRGRWLLRSPRPSKVSSGRRGVSGP